MNSNRKSPPSLLSQLRVRWVVIVVIQAITIFTVYWLLRGGEYIDYTNIWLGQTAVFLIYTLATIWQHLPENHRMGETAVLPTFGLGNHLTILRGLLISMLAGFLFIPWGAGWLAWIPALLYTAASIADILDGYAARVTNHATALGARLDITVDGLGILIVILLAVWYKQLPLSYLTIGLARYFQSVACGDTYQKRKPHPMPLLKTAEQFNIAPRNAVMVGDSFNDIQAAKAAGFRSVCVPYGYIGDYTVDQLGADHVVESLADLPDLLRAAA